MPFVEVVSTSEMKPFLTKDVKPGEMKQGKVGEKKVLIVNLNEKFYAIGDKCMHMGCSLSKGILEGGNVVCLCHGSTYSVETGSVISGPAQKPEPTFEIKLADNHLLIKI